MVTDDRDERFLRDVSASVRTRVIRYNLTAEQAIRLRDGGWCDLCTSWSYRLCVDHDHVCCPTPTMSCGRCVRGLVCHPCNTALGRFEDGLGRLRRKGAALPAVLSYLGIDKPAA